MAVYAATVSSPLKECERISRSIGLFSGKYNLTNYNATLAKQTGVTKHFVVGGVAGFTQGILAVIPSGVSDAGYSFEWDYAAGAFKAYFPTGATTEGLSVSSSAPGTPIYFCSSANAFVGTNATATGTIGIVVDGGPGSEAATDDDCGSVGFIAIGFVR